MLGCGEGFKVGSLACSGVGAWEGNSVGIGEGTWLGKSDGGGLGCQVGVLVGDNVGTMVGASVGDYAKVGLRYLFHHVKGERVCAFGLPFGSARCSGV